MDRTPDNHARTPERPLKARKPLTARRLRRKVWRGFLLLVLLALVGLLVLTRTGVTRALVLPRLASALSLDIDADSVVVASDLSVVLRGATFRIPGVRGEAGELLTVDTLIARLDWAALPSPAALREITLERPRLRVSQSKDTGEISAASLALFRRVGGGEIAALPTVVVYDGVFEMGEHDDQGYSKLAEVPLGGVLASQPDDPNNRSFFTLTRDPARKDFELSGKIDSTGLEIRIGGLTLDEWPPESVPTRLRGVWARMALKGRVIPRLIKISPAGDVQAAIGVEHVEVTLPFGAEPARLTDVDGSFLITEQTISADLTGRVASLTQHVLFDMWGFDPKSSPFVARLITDPFRFERDFQLLQYVPDIGHKQNERFGHPEADVEATVWLARGDRPRGLPSPMTGDLDAPGQIASRPADTPPEEVRVDGVLAMSHGTAAFRGFPYPFHDMSGVFAFTQDRLRIEKIRGVGPTGAILTGSGEIGPLGHDAAVDLRLQVESLPVDDVLLSVLGPGRRALLESLVSKERYEELAGAGLLMPADRAAGLRGRLAAIEEERKAWLAGGIAADEIRRLDQERDELEAQLDALPPFRLGGEADAVIHVVRLEGDESIWTRDVQLTFDRLGLLSKYFPLPTIGRGVKFSITDGRTTFRIEDGETLGRKAHRGGKVSINAEVALDSPHAVPNVTIAARGVPIDDLLIHAVSGPAAGGGGNGPGELARVLTSLGLRGRFDCDADVFPAGDNVGYRIEARPVGVSASVEDARINADAIGGRIVVEPMRVMFDLTGRVSPEDVPVRVDGARLKAEMTLPEGRTWGDNAADRVEPAIEAAVALPGADLRLPAERLIAVFDAEAADKMRDLRARYNPSGVLDVESRLTGRLGRGGRINLDAADVIVTGVDHLGFDAGPLRLGAASSRGTATIRLAGDRAVVFDGFAVDLTADGVPSGRLTVDDTIPLGENANGAWAAALDEGRFESPLTRHAVARASAGAASAFDRFDPSGTFDLILHHRPDGAFDGVLHPGRLALTTPRGALEFPAVKGAIVFTPEGGRLDKVECSGDGFSLLVSGGWTPAEIVGGSGGGATIDLTLGLDAEVFDESLLGLAPDAIGGLFDAMDIGFGGAVHVRDLRVLAETLPGGGVGRFETRGSADVSAGRLNVGAPITELDGSLSFEARNARGGADPEFSLTLDADRWRLLGLRMTRGRVEVLSGREPGSVLVPVLEADAHGGRLSGLVRMTRDRAGRRRYRADVQLAEVRLAPLLEDVTIEDGKTLADEVRAELETVGGAGVWDRSEDRSRGVVSASLTLAGVVGSDEERRGRGRVVAGGGPVLLLPLLTPLVEFSNLVPPVGDELGLALANFYIDQRGVTFEDIAVFSDQIELLGYGTMTLPGARLDLRVRSRALDRIPVVSGMIEKVRDELLTTRLTGPIGDPVFSVESFAATRRVMGSLLGGGDDGFTNRFREISRSAAAARQRVRAAGALLERISPGGDSPGVRAENDAP